MGISLAALKQLGGGWTQRASSDLGECLQLLGGTTGPAVPTRFTQESRKDTHAGITQRLTHVYSACAESALKLGSPRDPEHTYPHTGPSPSD